MVTVKTVFTILKAWDISLTLKETVNSY